MERTHNKSIDCRFFINQSHKSMAEETCGRDIVTITLPDLERDFIGSCKLFRGIAVDVNASNESQAVPF